MVKVGLLLVEQRDLTLFYPSQTAIVTENSGRTRMLEPESGGEPQLSRCE